MTQLKAKFSSGIALVAMAAAMTFNAAATSGPDMSEQKRDHAGFDSVKGKGPIDTRIKVGGKFSVTVKAKDHMMDKIVTQVKGDTLVVKLKKGEYDWRDHGEMVVYVTLPSLEEVTTSGSGDAMVSGDISVDSFEVNINGSGDVSIKSVKVKNLDVDLNGSGDLKIVGGKCGDVDASLRGSGDIDIKGVKCDTGDMSIMGSGDIAAYVKKTLKASIMGSGDVTVYGSPEQVSSRTFGSGEVHTRR